ncbi:hypothetical protein GB937_007808 [Aspergillus fischeri]|nr:hypothetical protein GB937_007808 [Aspergillus fischeri]
MLGAAGGPGKANWAAASYPFFPVLPCPCHGASIITICFSRLPQGTFVLISGRLGAVYRHRHILITGASWLVACSLANGFCTIFLLFNAAALIATTIPPGGALNVTLGFMERQHPLGFYLGWCLCSAFELEMYFLWFFSPAILHTECRDLNIGRAILGTVVFGLLGLLLPTVDFSLERNGKIDWIGA